MSPATSLACSFPTALVGLLRSRRLVAQLLLQRRKLLLDGRDRPASHALSQNGYGGKRNNKIIEPNISDEK
eukprot:6463575-Amphidinium_carterae.1